MITKEKWLEVIDCKEIKFDLLRNNADKAYNKIKKLQYMSIKSYENLVKDRELKKTFYLKTKMQQEDETS